MTAYVRRADVEAAPMLAETILFDPAAKQFCVLNATAAFVWNRLSEPATADALMSGLSQHFDVDGSKDVASDVRATFRRFGDLPPLTRVDR